jgi:flagellar hook-associated protein 3 FlgL
MRISNRMMTYNFLNSLNKSMTRQNELQEKLSDGKAIHRPSDDPVRTMRSLYFNTNLTMNEQYSQNLKDAISWMDTTDSQLSNASSLLMRAKEVTIQATAANPSIAYEAAAKEIDGIINELVAIGNTKIGDRYIFAGQADKTQPYTKNGDVITYNGDTSLISMRIHPGNVNPAQDSVNIPGNKLFGENNEVLNHLIEIKNKMLEHDNEWLSNTGLQYNEEDQDVILRAQTEVGTRRAAYEMADNIMQTENVIILDNLSANEDLDVPKAIIDFKTSESVYNAALSVGAKIMPPSLVDFLN